MKNSAKVIQGSRLQRIAEYVTEECIFGPEEGPRVAGQQFFDNRAICGGLKMNIVKELVKMARSVIAAKGTMVFPGNRAIILKFVPDTWDYNKWDTECKARYNDFNNLFEAGWVAEFGESAQLEMGDLPAPIGVAGMRVYLEIMIFIDSEKFRIKDMDRGINDKFWLVIKRMEKAGYRLSRG